jgi:glycosyltransferase involved in cell wall biosynthesis
MSHGEAQHARTGAPRRRRIACLSSAPWNPYLRLLYGHLEASGFEVAEDARLSLRWICGARASVGLLHFHWPQGHYRYERGPAFLRPFLSRVKLALFLARLVAARLLGYRLVWTIHQVLPHESVDAALDRRAARLLAHNCQLLVAHDRWTAVLASSELGMSLDSIAVIPHGSYIGVYPDGRPRTEVRRELGLPQDSFVFLCFGELRAYKEIDLLLEAFASMSLPDSRLVVSGHPKLPSIGASVRAAAATDSRITGLLDFVPDDRVAELFHACDAAVHARGDAGTSGSLVLALSLGLPLVAADTQTTRELMRDGDAGWLFRPHDLASLRQALERAASDPAEAGTRGARALGIARELDWSSTAGEFARLLDAIPD